jgi:hypothetical protein
VILTSSQLAEALNAAGIYPTQWSLADRAYALPTRQWVLGAYAEALRRLQFEFAVNHWTAEDNDCDDFARLAAAFAQILHTNTAGHPAATALAVGELWYFQDGGGGHAIVFAVCGPNPEDVLLFEPQTAAEKTLSDTEKQNATLARA